MVSVEDFDDPMHRLCAALIMKAGVDLLDWERNRVRPRNRVPLLNAQRIARNARDWLLGACNPDRLPFVLAADVLGVHQPEVLGCQIIGRVSTRAIFDLDAPAVTLPDGRWTVCPDLVAELAPKPGGRKKGFPYPPSPHRGIPAYPRAAMMPAK